MKTEQKKLPTIKELAALFVALKPQICDEFRCSDDADDTAPGIQVTIGWTPETGGWSYQTGDNSFTGGAYSHPHWAVCYLYRRSNSCDLAREAINQLAECVAY